MDNYNQISEELLAAFLEGKTDSVESMQVLDAIANDDGIYQIIKEVDVLDEIDTISLHDGDYGYWGLGIDPVFTTEELRQIQIELSPTEIAVNNEDTIEFACSDLEVACCCEHNAWDVSNEENIISVDEANLGDESLDNNDIKLNEDDNFLSEDFDY